MSDVMIRPVGVLGELALARRNAEDGTDKRFHQWRLREFISSLVEAYGYRDDYTGSSPPWRVPFIPQPFAGEMVAYFAKQAAYWLDRSVPEEAKQPNLIRNRLKAAMDIVGRVKAGVVESANAESYEDAPASVAGKAPAMFKAERPAGQPSTTVLKPAAAWHLLDNLQRLAIHFDALAGQPTKLDIYVDEFKKQAVAVGESAASAVEGLAHLPGKKLLTWAAIAAAGLGALYVVTR
jgi:hypothetical protein